MTIDEAKAEAKALRVVRRAEGVAISHAEALELVARSQGARDWNTLHARLALRNAPPALAVGDRVRGRYLGQAFAGKIMRLSGPIGHREIEIHFDAPVDAVKFPSFSNLRSHVRATIDESGRSHGRTSDGAAQLVVEREMG
jgi:Glyoxalase superfamily protein